MGRSLNHSPVVYHLSLLNILVSELLLCLKKKKKKISAGENAPEHLILSLTSHAI